MSSVDYAVKWSNSAIAEGLVKCPDCSSSLSRAGYGISSSGVVLCSICGAGHNRWD